MRQRGSTIVYCLALLILGEVATRLAESGAPAPIALGQERPLVVLGSSRSARALSASVIEHELRRLGFRDPSVRNESIHGATSVGLLQQYIKEIHPQAQGVPLSGVLAIEVRGSALNDSYVTPVEKRLLVQMDLSPIDAEDRFAGWPGADLWRSIAQLNVDRAARVLFWNIQLFYLEPGWLDPLERWLRGAGRAHRRRPPKPDLDAERWRNSYTRFHLKDYRLGGVQLESLRRLIAQAREDGLRPVLYMLPITEIHRRFYAAGEYERFLSRVRALSDTEGVALLDFDTGHGFELADFYDTHHLAPHAVDEMSRSFARSVSRRAITPFDDAREEFGRKRRDLSAAPRHR